MDTVIQEKLRQDADARRDKDADKRFKIQDLGFTLQ